MAFAIHSYSLYDNSWYEIVKNPLIEIMGT